MGSKQVTIRISLPSATAVVAGLVGLWLLSQIPHLLVELFLSVVIACAMLPAVRYLTQRRWPRVLAVVVTALAVFGAMAALALLVVPQFIDQATTLASSLPALQKKSLATYEGLRGSGGVWAQLPPLATLPDAATERAGLVLGQGLGWVRQAAGALSTLAIVVVVAIFMLLDGPHLERGFLALVPPHQRTRLAAQVEPVALKLGLYVRGTLISIAFFVVFQSLALTLFKLPLALGVSVVGGVLEVIPFLGTIVGVSLAVAVAASVSIKMVVIVLAVFLVGRLIQDNLVNPYVFSTSLELPPTLVTVALLLGTELMGIEGALISMPLLAVIQVLVQNLYVEPRDAEAALEDLALKGWDGARDPRPVVEPERHVTAWVAHPDAE